MLALRLALKGNQGRGSGKVGRSISLGSSPFLRQTTDGGLTWTGLHPRLLPREFNFVLKYGKFALEPHIKGKAYLDHHPGLLAIVNYFVMSLQTLGRLAAVPFLYGFFSLTH